MWALTHEKRKSRIGNETDEPQRNQVLACKADDTWAHNLSKKRRNNRLTRYEPLRNGVLTREEGKNGPNGA